MGIRGSGACEKFHKGTRLASPGSQMDGYGAVRNISGTSSVQRQGLNHGVFPMRFLKRVVLALVLFLLLGGGVLYALASRRLAKPYELIRRGGELPTDSASIARGEHLATAIGKCAECHGDGLGGKVMVDDPMFGRFVAPNLTRGVGGVGSSRSDADLATALRHGVGVDGKTLVFMPS